MKWTRYILLFCTVYVCGQKSIDVSLVKKITIEAQSIIAVDNFETLYYTFNNTLYKKTKDNTSINYSNTLFGEITTVDAFNPLKIILFYKDFNTVIILDNRLSEIYKINFNRKQPYKNVSHISTGYDNAIWIFNQDLQQLELYDYKTSRIKATTIPVQSNVLDLKSNYNYCWMLTENYLYQYSYFGSLISKIENKGFTAISQDNGNLILKANTTLYYVAKESDGLVPIAIPKLLINQFSLTNETLYIYNNETLYQFQLKIE